MVDRREFLRLGLAAAAVAPSVSAAQGTAPNVVSPNADADFDYVIVGGGHNALACAAYLGRAGYTCVVLEAKATVGGNTSTEQLTVPGFWHESCANTPGGLFRNNVRKELELDKFGVRFASDPAELSSLLYFSDGTPLQVWKTFDRTLQELSRFSTKDAARLRVLYKGMGPVLQAVRRFNGAPIGYAPTVDETLMKLPDGPVWVRRMHQTMADTLTQEFESEKFRSFLTYYSTINRQLPYREHTGLDSLDQYSSRQEAGWVLVIGGTSALVQGMVRAVEANRGTVLPNKFVTGLILQEGRCVGVKTAGGETFRARYGVVSSMHINQLVKMAPEALGPVYVESATMLKPLFAEMLFSVHFALHEAPRWKVGDQRITCPAVQLIGTLEDRIRQANASLEGRIYEGASFLQVFNPTVVDPSRAPPGKHVMKFEVLAPYALQGGAAQWDELKRGYADQLMARVRQYADNLDDSNIIARRIATPLDIEGHNINNVGGSCHGAAENYAQSGAMRPVPGWAKHRTPIAGLYQTGALTHPGGSVRGEPGRNAAWIVLEDQGKDINKIMAAG
jgi:phytoene dehydrogenase-like protein